MGGIRLVSPQRPSSSGSVRLAVDNQRQHSFTAHSTAGRVLICTVLFSIVAFIYCRQTLSSDPQSSFFDSRKAYELRYSKYRLQEARTFIAAANENPNVSTAMPASHNQPVLCAGMVTVKRNKVQYLNDTIGSMLVGLTPEERSAIDVRLLFADFDASIHPEWNELWLKKLDWWGGYNLSEAELEHVRELKAKTMQAKGMFDYKYILEECYNKSSAPYIAFFEDDLVFSEGWLAKAFDALASLKRQSTSWLYLRLFYTESQLGWDKSIDDWYTNPIAHYVVGLCICISLMVLTGLRCLRLPRNPDSHKRCGMLAVLFCVTIPMFLTLLLMVGPSAWTPLNGVVRMDRKGCCTQAFIYPREQVPILTNMLQEVEPGPTDLIIKQWANKHNLARYAIAPPLVQHVGIISTRGMGKKFTQQTFAYRFEHQNSMALRKQHEKLARWGIWRAEIDD